MLSSCSLSWNFVSVDDDVAWSGEVLPAINNPGDTAHDGNDGNDDDNVVHGRARDYRN